MPSFRVSLPVLLSLLGFVCLIAPPAVSQERERITPPVVSPERERLALEKARQRHQERVKAEAKQKATLKVSESAATTPGIPSDAKIQKRMREEEQVILAHIEAEKAAANYEAFRKNHTTRVFQWQYYQSIVIFVMVILLVVAGTMFSAINFFDARSMSPFAVGKDGNPIKDKEGNPVILGKEQIDLDLSSQGLKLKTSLIGFAILVVSMGFLFLYVTNVYPITDLRSPGKVAPEPETSK